MSYSPNKLLYNGEVLLSKSLRTGENQSPLQMYQYGYPFPLLPNLNFLPENVSSIAISEVTCSPSTPITLDNSRKRIQTSLPVEVIDLVDESETNGNMQGKNIGFSQPGSHEFAELFSRSVMSSQVVSPQQQGDENIAVKLPEEASFQLLETEERGKGEMQGIDLNKTPQQKPKRKKHRPKVLREGKPKPARTPKPVTPMPVTPKPARNKEGSTGKRKYVRKNKEGSTGKRKYVRKNKVLDSSSGPSCTPCENVDHPDSGSRSKNVKRCLNFNAEEPQEIHGFLESSVISTHYPPLAQNTCVSSTIVPPAQRREVVVENSMARSAPTPNSSVNQFSSDQYIRIPGTPAPSSQPLRRETMRTNHTLNGYIRVVKSTAPSQQTSRREIIHENLKQLARKNDSRNTSGSNFARLPEVGQKSELNFNSTSNMVLQGAKRNYNLVDGEDISNYINFMNGDKEINCVSKGHHAYFHESHKKKRTEKEHNELVSNAASVTCNPSNSLKTNLMVANSSEVFNFAHMESPISSSRNMTMVLPENCRDFTFADAQRLMAREKLRASEHMLSFNQNDRGPENTLQAPVMVGISNSVRTTKDESLSTPVKPSRRVNKDRCLPHGKSDLLTTAKDISISTPLKPSGLACTECSQPSTPAQVNRYTGSPPSGVHGTQISKESHFIKNQVKVKTKSCEQNNFSRPMPSNTKQVYPREGKVASCSNDPCQGQRFDQVTTLPSGNFKGKNPNPRVSSLQNWQSSIKFKESPNGIHVSGAIFLPGDPLDDIVQKLRCLTINRSHEKVAVETTNSLVPYGGGGSMMVPYEGPFDPTKKRRSRAKVDLDPETERVWKLLMGKECSDEGMDINKEKWWEEERRIFRGRVDSFIARMHLVQGDRRFSQWKGSVVDSVVGVFLTQNVSDHLSSSAFMSVAARFPCKPKSNNNNLYTEKTSSYAEQQDGGVISCDRNMWETNMLGQDLCNQGPSGIPEVTSLAGELITGNIEPLQRNTTGTLLDDSKNKQDLRERDLESGHKALGGASIAESEDRRSVEDALSSQNSVVSSQNSSEDLVHRGEQIILRPSSQSDPETLANDMNNYLDSPTSFLELLQMAETTKLQEFYIHDNERIPSTEFSGAAYKSSCLDTDSITCTSNQANYFEGECLPMYGSKHPHQGTQYGFLGLSCAPSISYSIQNPSNSNLMACRNPSTSGEEIILQSPLTDTGMNTAYNNEVMDRRCSPFAESSAEIKSQHDFMHSFYSSSCVQSYLPSRLTTMQTANGLRDETNSNVPLTAAGISRTIDINILDRDCELLVGNSTLSQSHDGLRSLSYSSSPYYSLHNLSNFNPTMVGVVNAAREDTYRIPSTASETYTTNKTKMMAGCFPSVEESTEESIPQSLLFASKTKTALDTSATISNHFLQPSTSSEVYCDRNGFCCSNLAKEQTEISSGNVTSNKFSALRNEHAAMFQQKDRGAEFQVKNTDQATRNEEGLQNGRIDKSCLNLHDDSRRTSKALETIESNLKVDTCSSQKVSAASTGNTSKTKKIPSEAEKQKAYDWDSLRKQTCQSNAKKERNVDAMDSVDWEEVRCADVSQISQTIRERGMNNMLAERIKEFLNRLVKDHGSIDLEWLRDAPPDTVKDYLLSIRGLGLKSVECVRLLTLHHLAFPVDTNVGRICVRLGWVPLQPLPESLQLHLLEMYPVLETIQKYLWPRLCKLDQRTLYELHYQLITFGKVFCTKSKPNCNACPMRGECKHFASAFASARFALPGPEERGLVRSTAPVTSGTRHNSVYNPAPPRQLVGTRHNSVYDPAPPPQLVGTRHNSVYNPAPPPQLVGTTLPLERSVFNNCEPIIEEPATPEPEFLENSESAIEDAFDEDPEEIPTIKLNLEKFTKNIQNYVTENNMELQDGEMSNALVAISAEAASIPMPKLKDMSRLRTEHLVYELPDSHPLLEGLDKRERDDPSSYLLAIWSPGETAQSTDLPTKGCDSQDIGKLCDKKTCFACNSIREAQSQTVRATLLIPCRTAMRGSFPLNGTYFQVNEVFADHDSSRNPINVPREWIWNLPRRTVYFGTSIPTIFKGLTTEGIQYCFWRGFVCVRGFDRKTRAPKPLYARLHFPASKAPRSRQAAAAAAREEE